MDIDYPVDKIELSEWNNEFIKAIINSNSFCVALFTVNKELLYANEAMTNLFCEDHIKSFINPTLDELIKKNNHSSLIFDGFITLSNSSHNSNSIKGQVYRKDDKLLVLGGVNITQLFQQNNKMREINFQVNNLQRELIKEKQNLEKTIELLSIAYEELAEVNVSKDKFISILAHDLKGPFQTILGLLEILKENYDSLDTETIKLQLNTIFESTKDTHNLLDDILIWIRSESGKLPYKPYAQNLLEVCKRSLEVLMHSATSKKITIQHHLDNDIIVYIDVNMIITVLRNLISNAIKFTNPNGRIDIYASIKDSLVTVTVKDTGVGIKESKLEKLFDISEKVTTKGTANEKGTGIGLLLCKELIERHKCKIWVESESGKGSSFSFTLPIYNKNTHV